MCSLRQRPYKVYRVMTGKEHASMQGGKNLKFRNPERGGYKWVSETPAHSKSFISKGQYARDPEAKAIRLNVDRRFYEHLRS